MKTLIGHCMRIDMVLACATWQSNPTPRPASRCWSVSGGEKPRATAAAGRRRFGQTIWSSRRQVAAAERGGRGQTGTATAMGRGELLSSRRRWHISISQRHATSVISTTYHSVMKKTTKKRRRRGGGAYGGPSWSQEDKDRRILSWASSPSSLVKCRKSARRAEDEEDADDQLSRLSKRRPAVRRRARASPRPKRNSPQETKIRSLARSRRSNRRLHPQHGNTISNTFGRQQRKARRLAIALAQEVKTARSEETPSSRSQKPAAARRELQQARTARVHKQRRARYQKGSRWGLQGRRRRWRRSRTCARRTR